MSKHTRHKISNLIKPGYSSGSQEEREWRSYVYHKPGVSFGRMKQMAEAFTKPWKRT